MSILRSEEISHKFMRIVKDQAVEVLSELGRMKDTIQFIDLNKNNPEAYKNFASLMKRCDEIERKINGFEIICNNNNIKLTPFKDYLEFDAALAKDIDDNKFQDLQYFDYIEHLITEDMKKCNELVNSTIHINETLSSLIERKNVYEVCLKLTESNQLLNVDLNDEENNVINNFEGDLKGNLSLGMDFNLGNDQNRHSSMGVIAGVVRTEDVVKLKRMIFRVSKGRAMPTFFDFPDFERYILDVPHSMLAENNQTGKANEVNSNALADRNMVGNKSIFVIFFPSTSEENFLHLKVLKVCDIFSASRYGIPKSDVLKRKIRELNDEINSNVNITREIKTSVIDFICKRGGNSFTASKYEMYKLYIKKEKMIYTTLSKCIMRDHFIDAEVYVHKKSFSKITDYLSNLYKNHDSKTIPIFEDILVHDSKKLPTLINTNEFTWAFQQIVDTYGIPRYGEINPTVFNIVTFPFLFGIMFGDIGHGALLLAFALYLVIYKDEINSSENTILKLLTKARYLFLFMGISAFYCGIIYDDFFSMPLGIFGGSCYENVIDQNKVYGYGKKIDNCVYPIGLDPKWYSSSNELSFMNSLKMKISVIFGVLQMIMGIAIKGFNSLHFNNYLDFFFEFIPQIVFMSLIFGYMNIMIIIKWTTDWSTKTTTPPSIVSQLLNIFLSGGKVDGQPLYGDVNGNTQVSVHLFILIVALICIPLMLFVKPIVLYCRHNGKKNLVGELDHQENEQEVSKK